MRIILIVDDTDYWTTIQNFYIVDLYVRDDMVKKNFNYYELENSIFQFEFEGN